MAAKATYSTIGLKNLVIAKLTKDDDTGVTYGDIQEVAGAISVAVAPQNTDPDVQYADDIEFSVVNPDPDVSITMELVDLPIEIQSMIQGTTVDKYGVAVSKATDESPYFAMGFKSEKADHTYRYVWLYKVRAQMHTENYGTRQGTTTTRQTASITWTAIKRTYDGLWRAKADEGIGGFTATKAASFLSTVYEPEYVTSGT